MDPLSVCGRCKLKKLGCSLMPKNPATGKTDRHALTAEYILNFRIGEVEKALRLEAKESRAQVKKGKQRARNPSDSGEPEASKSVPSPLTALAGLGALNLESAGSSAANTPANSPAVVSQAPLPKRPEPTPETSSKPHRASKRSASELVFSLSPSDADHSASPSFFH